jgi:hypothetical protein
MQVNTLTWSSEANEGGLELGSNLMSGWISFNGVNLDAVEVETVTDLVGDKNSQRPDVGKETHLESKKSH